MDGRKNMLKYWVRKISTIIAVFIAALFTIGVTISFLVATPAIQNRLVYFAKDWLQKQLGVPLELAAVDVALPNKAVLEGVAIYDDQGQVLARVEKLKVDVLNFSFWDLLLKEQGRKDLFIRYIELDHPEFYFHKRADSTQNIDIFSRGAPATPEDTAGRPLHVILPEIYIHEGIFYFRNDLEEEVHFLNGKDINYTNLLITGIQGKIDLDWRTADDFSVFVRKLVAQESHSGFGLSYLRTRLVADTTATGMAQVRFEDIEIDAQETRLRANLDFPESNIGEVFDDWLDRQFIMRLSGSKIEFATLDYFAPNTLPVSGIVVAQGDIFGTLNNLISKDFSARLGDSTQIRADIAIRHLRDLQALDLDVRFERSLLHTPDIQQFLPKIPFPQWFVRLGRLSSGGSFIGAPDDFVINADMLGKSGRIACNLRMQLPPSVEKITYSGFLRTEGLQMARLDVDRRLNSSLLNFQGKVQGEGVNLEELNTQFDALISQSDLWGRSIDTLYTNIRVADRKIAGNLQLLDPEGRGDLEVDLDFSQSPGIYKIKGGVGDFNLQKFAGWDPPMRITSELNIDLTGDSLDNLNGRLEMVETELTRLDDSSKLSIPDLWITSHENTSRHKYIVLKSSLLDADIAGNFTFKKAVALTQSLAEESRLFIENDTSQINAYYEAKRLDSSQVRVQIGAATRDSINLLFDFLGKDMFISPDLTLIGDLKFSRSEQANITIQGDSARYGEFSIQGGEAHLNLIKYAYRNYLLVAGGVIAQEVRAGNKLALESVECNIDGLNRKIESDLFALQTDSDNRILLKAGTHFLDNGKIVTSVDSLSSQILFQGDTLTINEWNAFTYFSNEDRILVEDFVVKGTRGILSVAGEVSRDSTREMVMSLQRFDLDHLNAFYDFRYPPQGMIDVEVRLLDLLQNPQISMSTGVSSFELSDFEYGDGWLKSSWSKGDQTVMLSGRVAYQGDTTLALDGTYDFSRARDPIRAQVSTPKNFPLSYISPFVKGQLYGIEGKVALESFEITGAPDSLQVRGTGHFDKAKFGIDYFKTAYRFDGQIEFSNDKIHFPRITLLDSLGHTADFYGDILHQGMRDFEFDLQLDRIRDFLVMNTTEADNDLFYGHLFLRTGLAAITGNLEQLNIYADVMSGPNSYLAIPLTFEELAEKPDFIHFVGGEEEEAPRVDTGIKGFDLNLKVRATPDALVELIFDRKVGDIIRGRGEGTVNLRINQAGEFFMTGDYEILDGDYLFTARNVLNKKFEVKPGGTIRWLGDPYDAQVNIEAIYALNAEIKDLINIDQSLRVPTHVLMDMTGSLMQPEISLDIELPNLRAQEAATIASFLRSVQYDEQELNKQVFSLMVFNRFAPVGGFLDDNVANSGVTTSVSELISNQLNYWLSRALSDNINVNVGTNNFRDVSLLVSATLFNDRVTIERDGVLIGQGNNRPSVGNIRIIIRLTEPRDNFEFRENRQGELVLEVFNRENLDLSQQNSSQTGMGIYFKKDFDKLKSLLDKS